MTHRGLALVALAPAAPASNGKADGFIRAEIDIGLVKLGIIENEALIAKVQPAFSAA